MDRHSPSGEGRGRARTAAFCSCLVASLRRTWNSNGMRTTPVLPVVQPSRQGLELEGLGFRPVCGQLRLDTQPPISRLSRRAMTLTAAACSHHPILNPKPYAEQTRCDAHRCNVQPSPYPKPYAAQTRYDACRCGVQPSPCMQMPMTHNLTSIEGLQTLQRQSG